ncbi:hypothetical protein D3C75_958030 [compost metagenome]
MQLLAWRQARRKEQFGQGRAVASVKIDQRAYGLHGRPDQQGRHPHGKEATVVVRLYPVDERHDARQSQVCQIPAAFTVYLLDGLATAAKQGGHALLALLVLKGSAAADNAWCRSRARLACARRVKGEPVQCYSQWRHELCSWTLRMVLPQCPGQQQCQYA